MTLAQSLKMLSKSGPCRDEFPWVQFFEYSFSQSEDLKVKKLLAFHIPNI